MRLKKYWIYYLNSPNKKIASLLREAIFLSFTKPSLYQASPCNKNANQDLPLKIILN